MFTFKLQAFVFHFNLQGPLIDYFLKTIAQQPECKLYKKINKKLLIKTNRDSLETNFYHRETNRNSPKTNFYSPEVNRNPRETKFYHPETNRNLLETKFYHPETNRNSHVTKFYSFEANQDFRPGM
jgi:hypothetical protein